MIDLASATLASMLALQAPGRSAYSLVEVPDGSPPACERPADLLCLPPRFVDSRLAMC